MKNLTTSLSIRTISVCLFSVALISLIPTAVMAWGPARATFTMQNAAPYVTFNSITDNPTHGDERNFMRAKEKTANDGSYSDNIALTPGKQYTVMIFYHNNAKSSLNAGGTGIATGAYARAEVPAIVENGVPTDMEGYVGAANANPQAVYDEVKFTNSTGKAVALRYVPGSTVIHSFGAVNNKVMGDTILSASGVPLGYGALDGKVPGCNEYSGYITFNIQADQPSFTFKKEVRVSGTTGWKDSVEATPGTKLDYLLSYKNTSATVTQKDVTFKDELPKGITYIAGSSRLTAGTNITNKTVGDGISTTGLNVGDFAPGAAAYLVFSATVDGAPCTVMKNIAAVETGSGYLKDDATVTSTGQCTLPTTGPIEVISGFVGLAAITIGIVYYFKSRRELHDTLLDAQTNAPASGATSTAHAHNMHHNIHRKDN